MLVVPGSVDVLVLVARLVPLPLAPPLLLPVPPALSEPLADSLVDLLELVGSSGSRSPQPRRRTLNTPTAPRIAAELQGRGGASTGSRARVLRANPALAGSAAR